MELDLNSISNVMNGHSTLCKFSLGGKECVGCLDTIGYFSVMYPDTLCQLLDLGIYNAELINKILAYAVENNYIDAVNIITSHRIDDSD